MANSKAAAPAASTEGAGKGGKKKLLLALALGLPLLLAASGGGTWYYLTQVKNAHEADAADEDEIEAEAESKPEKTRGKSAKSAKSKAASKAAPIFVTLEPFTVNLSEPEGSRYLQVGVVLEAADSGAVDAINQHMPMIRNRILLLLSSKHADELATADGKQKLATEIVAAAREPLGSRGKQKSIEDVYFASFVIQ